MKKKSWKTTTLGIIGAIGLLVTQATAVIDDDPATVIQWDQVSLALGVLGVSIFARDNNVSSEQAGAK